ncbi:MAG: insulinase family protein [Collinsella sp.]|nr:insulinase family protein [Collinsella sp.]
MTGHQSTPLEAGAARRAAALLSPQASIHGFSVIARESIPELDADAYTLRHDASGARLLYLPCDDENKAFSIAFKTPPADDTGVFHILEHSVLCGSERYPVKEPFVDLIKSSMQTFLNAMTYPDKTVYPVASTNEQDLMNLASVYMDAVLNPAIYTKPSIFQQEGWHYELDKADPALGTAERLRYNGVVFNEMKGALSDPMDVMDNAVNRALFPDTAYAFESGGNPRAIPQLTYEGFLDTHARHYNLANSYITLYGDLDPDRFLEFLDKEFLSRDNAASRAGAGAPNELLEQQPVICDLERVTMRTAPDNAIAGLAYVIGNALDRKRLIAADIIFEAILGSNEAPVKKALMAAELGGNVSSYTAGDRLQPYELIMVQNAKPNVATELRRIVEDECRRLVQDGIPRDRLEAVISSEEYDLRQRDYGIADGVAIACDALGTWLYSDDCATLSLQYGPFYEELRRDLDTTYYEDLLREIVLESNHRALVDLVPITGDADDEDGEERELEEILARLTEDDRRAIDEDVAELRRQQEAEDSPEAKATLPRLHVSDIGPGRPEPKLEVDKATPIPCLKHDIPTHRLAYALVYFDLSHLSYAELPYATILSRLMQQLATKRRSAAELDSHIGSNLGFLSFRCEVLSQPDWRLAAPKLTVSAGALSEKIDALATIPREVWSETVFEDIDRIHDVLVQMRIGMEQGFINAGHQAALSRVMSYVSPAAVVAQQLSGIDFHRFLRDLLDDFDARKDELVAKLQELQERIFTSTGTIASFTGSEEDYARYWASAGDLGLSPRTAPAKELYVPAPEPKHEAFVIPSDICFAARATDPRALGIATDGSWNALSQVLTYEYLWNEIRVKGGAYGCGFRAVPERQLAFYTYRDPAIDPSLKRIANAGGWLSGYQPDADAFEGVVVSCASGFDVPVKPYGLAKRQDLGFLSKQPHGWRAKLREELLATTPDELRSLAETVTRIASEAPACVFGGREIIEASGEDWEVIDLFA